MLSVDAAAYSDMLNHARFGLPDEACGLMLGSLDDATVTEFVPTENDAHSSRIYAIAPKAFLRIDRYCDDNELDVVGVMHSHTHTAPYPSQTDVDQAPDPLWHYVIVSLRLAEPVMRSFTLANSEILEESVVVGNE